MSEERCDIFLNYSKNAFQEIASELTDAQYDLCETFDIGSNEKIAVIIGVTGKSKGRIMLQCDAETAEKFAVSMNCGDPLDAVEDKYFYMAEFANMFCGRAVTNINNYFKQREAWLCPPAIFSGVNLEIITPTVNSETVYYSGEQGSFMLDIGFEGEN